MSDFLDKELKKIEKGLGADEDYNTLLEMWRDEKKRRQFAENELSNQNELKKTIDLKNEEIQNLDLQHKKDQDIIHQKSARILSLEQIEEQHHKLNRETMKENKQLRNDNKQLAKQVNDQMDRLRRDGL